MKARTKLLMMVMTFAMILVVATGCLPGPAAETTAEVDREDDRDTLIIASQLEFRVIDPFNSNSSADANISASVFDSLIAMDVRGNAFPLIAHSWDISDDGLVYTFHLRDYVYFHDGSKLTADDVAFSFDRMAVSAFRTATANLIDHVNVLDDYTIEVVLVDRAATFMTEIASQFVVFPREATTALGDDFAISPIGSGPYRFVSMSPSEVVLEAFDDYWDGVAPIRNLIYLVIPDPSTALIALETGQVDILDFVPEASFSIVEENPNLTLLRTPFTRLMQIHLNTAREPFDNILVRQAVALAMDKELLVQATLGGFGTVAYGQINDRYIGYHPGIAAHAWPFDPQRAREKLAEAGFPDGQGLPQISITTIDMFRMQVEMVQAFLRDIGMHVDIEIVELSAWLDMASNRDVHMGLMSWTGGADASIYDRMLSRDGVSNTANFFDEYIEEWLAESVRELDPEVRSELFYQIFSRQLELVPYVPLYFPDTVTAGRNDVDFATIRDFLIFKGNLYSFR
ncbi:MAG: ABC transporter substrate-binding protein [Defluviitaleaceae bacterium]|nr:ABC transporter substrate-binding protein [Defluviitaleaceae bacterium]